MTEEAKHGDGERTYTIFVNTRAKTVTDKHQTYESIVRLATGSDPQPNATYTVTFERTEHSQSGELVAGGKGVNIIDGKSSFHVEETGQS